MKKIYIREEAIKNGEVQGYHGPFETIAEATAKVERTSTATRMMIQDGEALAPRFINPTFARIGEQGRAIYLEATNNASGAGSGCNAAIAIAPAEVLGLLAFAIRAGMVNANEAAATVKEATKKPAKV